ncbi:TetR family transcriptional regulator [Streptococcus sp. DD11]|nr:TetR family transcriptional regulator [Streptococcus sp. DD11]
MKKADEEAETVSRYRREAIVMSEKKISEKSLANLRKYNQESNQITRESLEISLMQLLEKKELKKITISELVERAGVSRAAFYRNYTSKEQILEEIFRNTVQGITDKLEEFNFKTEMYQIWLFFLRKPKKKPE